MSASTVQTSPTAVHATEAPLRLPDVLAVVEQARGAAYALACGAAELDATLAQIERPLAERIERNRRRSARAHATATSHDGNGHARDVVLKLTARGIEPVCRRCGRAVAPWSPATNCEGVV